MRWHGHIGHNYIGHNYIGRGHIGHNYTDADEPGWRGGAAGRAWRAAGRKQGTTAPRTPYERAPHYNEALTLRARPRALRFARACVHACPRTQALLSQLSAIADQVRALGAAAVSSLAGVAVPPKKRAVAGKAKSPAKDKKEREPKASPGAGGRMDGWTDGRTDGRTDVAQTHRCMHA